MEGEGHILNGCLNLGKLRWKSVIAITFAAERGSYGQLAILM